MTTTHSRRLAAGMAVLASAASPVALLAAEQGDALQEIVVTARKRAENLQTVPDSITAFSAEQIAERRIERISDAIALTPNVHMINDQDAATNIITVRGIGTNRNLAASVAYVVDGVVLPDSDAFSADMADVERIEILKGPQGGLYGRNAIAGVINLTSKRPTNDLAGEVRAGYSRGQTADLFAAVSGPLVADKLLGRVTLKYHDTDGLIENRFTGHNLDASDSTKATARLIWQPTSALSFDLRGSYFDENVDLDRSGGFRVINLQQPPFSLPKPLTRIDDFVVPAIPRYLALWSREQIVKAVANATSHLN